MNSVFFNGKIPFSQTHHLGALVRNAQRTQKIPFFIRENRSNTVWRTEPFSPVLQIFPSEVFPSPLRGEGEDEGFSEDTPSPLPSPASGRG